MTTSEGTAVAPRVRNVASNGFEIRLQEQESADGVHSRETVGYVAVQSASGQIGSLDFVSGLTTASVSHASYSIGLGSLFASPAVFLGNLNSFAGVDPAALRIASLSATTVAVFAQEEQSADLEITHAAESVGYLAIEAGRLMAQQSQPLPNNPPSIDVQSFSVDANAANGTLIGSVIANDPDLGDAWTFSIVNGNNGGAFAIGTTNGQLTVANANALQAGPHQLLVRVTDSQAQSDSAVVTVSVTSPNAPIGESGTATASQANGLQWHTVTLQRSYASPVVVMGPPSYGGSHPTTIRIRNVTNTSFQWQLDEWDYLDGTHGTESVGYIVMEAGSHTLPNGTRLVAGTANVNHAFATVSLPNLTGTPVVLTSVTSVVGGSAVATRLRNVSGNRFEVRLQEEEANDGTHSLETVSYIAIQPGSHSAAGDSFVAGMMANVSHVSQPISFGNAFNSPPVFLAAIQTFNGIDPAGLRGTTLSTTDARIFVEEEQSRDVEMEHAAEWIGYLAMEPGLIHGQTGGTMGISRPAAYSFSSASDPEDFRGPGLRKKTRLPFSWDTANLRAWHTALNS
jgi:hypothetical protein